MQITSDAKLQDYPILYLLCKPAYPHLVAFDNNSSPCNTIDFTGHY